jgi:hypothetical protein
MQDVFPIYLRLAPSEIAYVKFVFESYETVAVVRTIDRHAATLVVLVVPDFADAARAAVASLVGGAPPRGASSPSSLRSAARGRAEVAVRAAG